MKITVAQPSKSKDENLFSIFTRYSKVQYINVIIVINKKRIIIKPNSSPITDTMKSESLTGKKFKLFYSKYDPNLH